MNTNTYILTGCGSGIGRRAAQRLLEAGARVCATDLSLKTLEILKASAKQDDQLWLEELDVREPQQWEALFQKVESRWGKVDVLMNIAGVFSTISAEKLSTDLINNVIDVNLKGVIFGTTIGARHMIPMKSGHIINICSIAGILAPRRFSIYSASKYGVRGFSLAAAQDLEEYGLKLTIIYPTTVKTPMIFNKTQLEQDDVDFIFGGNVIEAEDVVDAIINKALKKAPLEITVPARDGVKVRLIALFSGIGILTMIRKLYDKKGLKNRQKLLDKLRK